MNKQIKEFAEQCGVRFNNGGEYQMMWIEKFADLVRQDEREACAKLCDEWSVGRDDICEVAKAIRARGKL